MKSRSTVYLFALLVLVFTSAAVSQTFRGSIRGTVTDSTGAAVSGAQVKVFSPDTGLSRTMTTNDEGEYSASELPLGAYYVTVAKEGFETTTLTGIPVSVGAPTRADVKLVTGRVQEAIEVTAQVPMVETTNNTTGGTIEASEAAELPVNGHDYTKLLELAPGAASEPTGSTESAGSYGLFSLNGNRGRSNNYLLDGTDMNDGYRNLPAVNQAGVWGCPGTILPVDALAEIPATGSPEAEFGRSSGATVNIVTKSGTNKFHGSFFENYRDGDLGARNYFNSFDPTTGLLQTKNSFTNHQFGGSVGGPIIKDRSFGFLAYEGQREDGGLPQVGYVPTLDDLTDFQSASGWDETINPVVQNLLNINAWGVNPLPTTGGKEIFTTPFFNNSDNIIAKVDQHLHIFSPGDLLTGRYFYSHGTQMFPLGMAYTGASAPGYDTITPTHVNVVSLSYTSIPRPNLIVELRAGYNRFLEQFLPQDGGLNPENTNLGLNTLPPGYNSHDLGLPEITVGPYIPSSPSISPDDGQAFSNLGVSPFQSRGRIDTNYQVFGNVSLTKGRHNFKTGYEWRRTFINSFINSGHRGTLKFSSLNDFLGGDH
jgi:hypothetical protein